MIKVSVIKDDTIWNKKIKKPSVFFDKIIKKFPKKYKFLNKQVNFSLLLSNNQFIKKLNYKFRNKKKHTDVLSFPLYNKKDLKKNLKNKKLYIGDIVISYQYIYKKKNIDNKRLLIKTMIHGFLHLLGFDHKTYKDYSFMNKEEKKIFNKIDLIIDKI
tara:strand:+ start:56 stop:529 length:474 start_codon:yes stop_codon:yes gene_type:complete